MGAILCGLRQSNPDSSDNRSMDRRMSIFEWMKSGCLKSENKKKRRQLHPEEKENKKRRQLNPQERKIKKMRNLTLEEFLIVSPGLNLKKDCNNGVELHGSKQNISRKVYPSSHKVHAHFTAEPTDSLFMKRLVKANEVTTEGELLESASLSRTQSGKIKKKVSFRLPEEADIIIIYSPETEVEDYDGR